MSKPILPDRETFDSRPSAEASGIDSAGGVDERPRIRFCFVGLGVGIRVVVRLGGLGVGACLIGICFRELGVGIRETEPRFEGLGVLARRTREANLAWVTVALCGDESEISDGAVTALWKVRFLGSGCTVLLPFFGDGSAEVDLVSLGAKMAHFGGEIEAVVERGMMVCSCVLEDEEEEDTV